MDYKLLFQSLLVSIASAFILYLCFCFAAWNLNPAMWSSTGRFFFSIMAAILLIGLTATIYDNN